MIGQNYRPPERFRLPWSLPIAKLPSAAAFPGQMIWALDLHQDFAGVALPGWAISDGDVWRPLRGLSVASVTAAAGTLVWTPLKHRPVLIVTATIGLGVTMTVAPSSAGAWNGCELLIVRQAGGAGALTLLGRAIAAGGALRALFDGAAYQPVPTTGLL